MHLLLVSATEFEISETRTWLNQHSQSLNALKVNLLISGIGQLQTTWSLQNSIHKQRPDLIIQAGIGGAVSKEDLGKVFVVRSEQIADLGVLDKDGFQSIFDMGLDNADRFPFKEGKLINPYKTLLGWTGLSQIEGKTVNEIKSTAWADLSQTEGKIADEIKSAKWTGFQRNSLPVVESMEGAALHYTCLMESIPFLQLRAVSNLLGERDKTNWKLKESVDNLNESLLFLIHKLEKADETLFRI